MELPVALASVRIREVIAMREYEFSPLPPEADAAGSTVAEDVAAYLDHEHGTKFRFEPPSFRNNRRWLAAPQGWIGVLPVPGGPLLSLRSRVPIDNVLRMLEWAWDTDFELPGGTSSLDSVHDLYESLALVLAERVLRRARQGLLRSYEPRREALGAIRGRIDPAELARPPIEVRLLCRYQEHTADVEDTRILFWTLYRVLRSGLCGSRSLPTVRRAFRTLRGHVSLQEFSASDCTGRTYNRLNRDYRPMHALCRFFLEGLGPRHEQGDRESIPFLLPMPDLFERFVASWLKAHAPAGTSFEAHHRPRIEGRGAVRFDVDLVRRDDEGRIATVIDMKYKETDRGPSTADVQQIVAYATAVGCRDGVLVYPRRPEGEVDFWVRDVRVRALGFGLGGDLEAAGHGLLAELTAGTQRGSRLLSGGAVTYGDGSSLVRS